jgi:hypothetical protein
VKNTNDHSIFRLNPQRRKQTQTRTEEIEEEKKEKQTRNEKEREEREEREEFLASTLLEQL